MLQGLENYPKYNSLEELIIAAKKAVYNNDILPDPENGLYYCSDDGLSEKYEQQSPFLTSFWPAMMAKVTSLSCSEKYQKK
ncbi:MAG: hypothetical protein HWD59_12790 [Coxiellaceae bacterium]|nr:MAG: hypothetical protein HWD59_12790 [Coxiellaceae bacterium]